MNRKYYKWIPIIGLCLVVINIRKENLDLDMDNPFQYYGSMLVQILGYYILILLL